VIPIRFNRWFWFEAKGATPRRVAGARRRQRRHNEKVSLFPEWHDTEPVEDQIKRIDDAHMVSQQKKRDELALTWRAARAMLREIPQRPRDQFLGWWRNCGRPGNADDFFRNLRDFVAGKLNIDQIVSNLRYIRRVGWEKGGWRKGDGRQWFVYGDPFTDEPDPRTLDYIREGAD
jgi:hypothetical protein